MLWKFIKKVMPQYKFYKFHATVIEQLQRVIDGKCNRLILQVPPRHGKSFPASQLLPAAYLLAHLSVTSVFLPIQPNLQRDFRKAKSSIKTAVAC